MRNLGHEVAVRRKILDDAQAVDVDSRQPGAERRLVIGSDGGSAHARDRRGLRTTGFPQAARRQTVRFRRLGAVCPQPARVVPAHQPFRMPRHLQTAVGQHFHRGGAQVFRQVDQHDHLLPCHRMNGAEIGTELSQPQAGQHAGAAVAPTHLYVAVHDPRAAERMANGIDIKIRHRQRLGHGTLRPAMALLSMLIINRSSLGNPLPLPPRVSPAPPERYDDACAGRRLNRT